MGKYSKQFAIYIGLLLTYSSHTFIDLFFPQVAEKKGISLSLIGVAFALNPIASIIVSPIIGKYLITLGRKRVLLASYAITSIALFILSPIDKLNFNSVIILSFLSRFIGGIGNSCLLVSSTTVFVSDYPGKVQIMIGRMEASIGVGLILGPLLGTALMQISFLATFCIKAGILFGFIFLASKMLGIFKEYQKQEDNFDKKKLIVKTKIILTVFVNFTFLFSSSFLTSILEIHLRSYGLSQIQIALCFLLYSITYFCLSLTGGFIFKKLDYRLIIFFGIFVLALAYLMLGPWTNIFPKSSTIIICSLPLFALGQSMTYMFSIPFMLKSAVECYGYKEDDTLNDIISSFATFGGALGEIFGPLFVGIVSDNLGVETCCAITGLINILFAFVFFLGTGYMEKMKCLKRKNNKVINNENEMEKIDFQIVKKTEIDVEEI